MSYVVSAKLKAEGRKRRAKHAVYIWDGEIAGQRDIYCEGAEFWLCFYPLGFVCIP
jgi:hypothetical protein